MCKLNYICSSCSSKNDCTCKGIIDLPRAKQYLFFYKPKYRYREKNSSITEVYLPIPHGILVTKNPQESRNSHHTMWSTIDIPTPRTSSIQQASKNVNFRKKGKQKPFANCSHNSFPIFCVFVRSIWRWQEEQVCTQSQWRTCRRSCHQLLLHPPHPLLSTIPLPLPQKPRLLHEPTATIQSILISSFRLPVDAIGGLAGRAHPPASTATSPPRAPSLACRELVAPTAARSSGLFLARSPARRRCRPGAPRLD